MSTPKDFSKKFPFSSVRQKTEAEIVAQNIMSILARTGDTFSPLTYEQYRVWRVDDGHFSDREKPYFEDVIGFCRSEETARLFSKSWKEV